MNSAPECIPCFFHQTVSMARRAGLDHDSQFDLLKRVAADIMPDFDPRLSPPEYAVRIQQMISEITGTRDPYAQEKQMSNHEAEQAVPALRDLIAAADDPLREAAMLAIAGNIIDFGIRQDLDVSREISRILQQERTRISGERADLFAYPRLREELQHADTSSGSILYLTDNAGEIVFDRLFIEQILRRYPNITVTAAVRAAPILNDVTLAEARDIGLDSVAAIITSGCTLPGTLLTQASPDFLEIYRTADIVISKGQGNFETLAGHAGRDVFFLFMVKCSAVAEHIGAEQFDIILKVGDSRP